jgi:hypothetical protein
MLRQPQCQRVHLAQRAAGLSGQELPILGRIEQPQAHPRIGPHHIGLIAHRQNTHRFNR